MKVVEPDPGGVPDLIRNTHILFKYDGNGYSVVDSTNYPFAGLYDKCFFTAKDGRVIIHKADYRKTNNNIVIYNTDGTADSLTLHTPHYITGYHVNRWHLISDVHEDAKGNIWFALNRERNGKKMDAGLSVYKLDGTWDTFTSEDGYMTEYFPHHQADWGNSVYKDCNGITQDISGRYWVGGDNFVNTIDYENWHISYPDSSEFFGNAVLYAFDFPEGLEHVSKTINSKDSIAANFRRLMKHVEMNVIDYHNTGIKVGGVASTKDGSVWIAVQNLGVLRYKPTGSDIDTERITENTLLYPQPLPSEDPQLTIQFGRKLPVTGLRILNIEGKVVYKDDIPHNFNTDRLEVSLQPDELSSGTYFAEIETKNKIIYKKLIIK